MKKLIQPLKKQILCFFFSTFFLTSTIFDTVGIILNFSFFFILLVITIYSKEYLQKEDVLFLCFFYSLPFLSLIFTPFLVFFIGNNYIKFFPTSFGRLVNSCLYFILFISITTSLNKEIITVNQMLSSYLIGCYVLFFFGLWQLMQNLFNVPYPAWETRSLIHSINIPVPFIKNRITSIAQEPAYLINFLIDPFIIIYFHNSKYKKIKLLTILIILFFTLSLAGYCNFMLTFIYIFLLRKRGIKKLFFFASILVFSISFLLFAGDIVIPVLSRLQPEIILNDSRFQEIYLPIKYIFSEKKIFNLFFGFGPKGYVFVAQNIQYVSGWLQGKALISGSVTSHVFLVDYFIEYGLLGLFSVLLIFSWLFRITWIIYKKTKNALPNVLLINYLISSFFSADYAAPHSVFMFTLLLGFYKENYLHLKLNTSNSFLNKCLSN